MAMMSSDPLSDADRLYQSGRYAEAQDLYQAARRLRADAAFQAFIDLNMAQCLRRQGRAPEAVLFSDRGLARVPTGHKGRIRAELLITLANCLADLMKFEASLSVLAEASALLADLDYVEAWQQAQVSRSRCLIELGRHAEAKLLLEEVLACEALTPVVEGQALTNLAVVEEAQGRVDIARGLYERNLVLHALLEDEHGRASTLINLALLERENGDRAKGRVLLRSAREVAERVRASDLLARIELAQQPE